MSASDKKKIRKEQALTERQRQEQAEAKKLKIYTITFVASLVLIVLIAATVLGVRAYTQSGITEKSTVAAVIGDKKMNAVEFSYYFNDAIDEYYNGMYEQFSTYTDSYLQAVGLDLSKPLDEQQYEEGKTWADYFVETALNNAKSDYALSEEAAKQNFKLSEDEQAGIDNMLTNLKTYATIYGYSSSKQYLRAMYGNGASEKSFKAYSERKAIADAYKLSYEEGLTFTDEDIAAHEKDNVNKYNSYTYSYAYLSYTDFRHGGTKTEGSETTYTEEENNAAREAVKFAAEKLASCATLEEMKEMIHIFEPEEVDAEEVTESEESNEEATDTETTDTEATTENEAITEEDTSEIVKINDESQLAVNDFTDTLHTEVNAPLANWLADASRTEGEIGLVENPSTEKDQDGNALINGYYVVCFKSKNDNNNPLANVRHLLVKFEGGSENEETGEIEYTEEEKAAAKALADGYYKTWQEGDMTEESFIALVKAATQRRTSIFCSRPFAAGRVVETCRYFIAGVILTYFPLLVNPL